MTNAIAGVAPGQPHIQPQFGTDAYAFNVVAHAAVGCGAAVASGGKCGPSALAGGVTSAAGPVINGQGFVAGLMINTALGGGAAVLGGGKFENGAITAAFGYMFNANGVPVRPDPTVFVNGPYTVLPGSIAAGLDPNLDPSNLNALSPITPDQQAGIASAVQTILNYYQNFSSMVSYLLLFPHAYQNFPDPTTGAVLPGVPGTGGYTAYDVGGPSIITTGSRIIVNESTGDAYYTNTHYKSFYSFQVVPGSGQP